MILAWAAVGCCPPAPTRVDSREQIVASYNANAAGVRRLWARVRVYANAPSMPVAIDSPGLLMLAKSGDPLGPQDFVLQGGEPGYSFRIGSSTADNAYYFWYKAGDRAGGFRGRNNIAGLADGNAVPFDPQQILAVLGVLELPADFTRLPTVLLTMDATPCHYAYVLTYISQQPLTRTILARRELYFEWNDNPPRHPYMVKFFDQQGRRIMTATLKDYRPIRLADEGVATSKAAQMPTDIDIVWPEKNSRLHLQLSEMTTEKKGKVANFLFWDRLLPGVKDNLVDVDADIASEVGQ